MKKSRKAAKPKAVGFRPYRIEANSVLTLGFGGAGLLSASLLHWWKLVLTSNKAHPQIHASRYHKNFTALINRRICGLSSQVAALPQSAPDRIQDLFLARLPAIYPDLSFR